MNLISSVKSLAAKHGTTGLVILGVAGIITCVVSGIKDSKRAEERIYKAKEKKAAEYDDPDIQPEDIELTRTETIKAVAPAFIPTTLLILVTAACFIGAHTMDLRKNAILATAYTVTNEAAREFQNKAVEIAGENVVDKIKTAVAEEEGAKAAAQAVEKYGEVPVQLTGYGKQLCRMSWTNAYFRSNRDKIEWAFADANNELARCDYLSVNELYDRFRLEACDAGSQFGWNSWIDDHLDPEIKVVYDEYFEEPCIVVGFKTVPRANYMFVSK